MGDELERLATASVELDRPVDVVRKLFFDAPRMIAQKIHHGVDLSLGDDGKTIKQTTKILSRTQIDEFVIEAGPDESWVRRYVGGANAGAQLVGRFFAAGDDK